MLAAHPAHHTYSFGEYVLDVARGALLKNGAEVRLRRQSFEVLRYLIEHHHRLVTKGELMSAIWPDTIVTEGSLTQCLLDVRRALGDETRQMVRTIPRRGYKFEPAIRELDVPAAAAPSPARRRWRPALVAGLLLALAASGSWFATGSRGPEGSTAGAPTDVDPRSIAVLPFTDMSERRDQEYLSDGVSEEILNLLARATDLHVVARTSSFSFKGRNADIATIAARLQVAWVLQGSVRRSGNEVRVTAQLIDASSGTYRWSETYDREFRDVLDLQTEIAAAVAEALETTLATPPGRDAGEAGKAEAHTRLLHGRHFFNRRGPGDVGTAAKYYRQALEIDPGFAPAWAALAGTYYVTMDERPLTQAELASWQNAVERALGYGPELADAHMRAGQYYWHMGQRDLALEHLHRADDLAARNPGYLPPPKVFSGSLDEAIARQRRIVQRDPVSMTAKQNLAVLLLAAGRLDEAYAEFRDMLELDPAFAPRFHSETAFIFILQARFDDALAATQKSPEGPMRDAALAMIHDALGNDVAAEAALQRLIASGGSVAARLAADVYARRGRLDEAFHWLQKGLEQARARPGNLVEPVWVFDVRLSPFLVSLHGDPRWDRFMALAAPPE